MVGTILTNDGVRPAPDRLLVVVAHPDDIDFGSAGTIATLTAAGTAVTYCLVTSGEAGDDDLTRTTAELAAEREGEQAAAAAEVGVSEIHWLHHPDGAVEANLALRRDIARVIRIERPDVVISQSPQPDWDRIYASHPDHLAVATATMAAVYPDARNPRAFPELLADGHQPHTTPEVWMGGSNPTLFIDISDQIDRKVAALKAHASQTSRMDNLESMLRDWAALTAKAAGMSEGRYAEGFHAISTA